MFSASQNSDGDLSFAATGRHLQDYLDQFEPTTENGHYLTIENVNNINKNSSTLSVLHLNIRSLNKHADELVNLLSSFKFSFDCICLT